MGAKSDHILPLARKIITLGREHGYGSREQLVADNELEEAVNQLLEKARQFIDAGDDAKPWAPGYFSEEQIELHLQLDEALNDLSKEAA